MRRSDKYRFLVILAGLVVLQFSVRPRLGDDRIAPDFMLLALLIYTIRAQPGRSAGAGFLVGLLRDALTPASFGSGALAHTVPWKPPLGGAAAVISPLMKARCCDAGRADGRCAHAHAIGQPFDRLVPRGRSPRRAGC